MYCQRDYSRYSAPESFIDHGSKFVCGSNYCGVVPSAPSYGAGVYSGHYGGGPPPCNGVLADNFACGALSYASDRHGPAGWVELGWVGSIDRSEVRNDHFNHRHSRLHPRAKQMNRKTDCKWTPRSQYRKNDGKRCESDDDLESGSDCACCERYESHHNRHESGRLEVQCRVRRYRLYARPYYGWCRGYDAHQWQYAVVEEGMPRCDAIFIVLRDNPRAGRYDGGYSRSFARQELQSGDVIRIPGEPSLFRVHLYADDDHY